MSGIVSLMARRTVVQSSLFFRHAGRMFSSQHTTSAESKPVSPHVGFYKVFGAPVAKVFLMATFTYQLAYWLWVKLEKDEIRNERQGELLSLEQKLQALIDEKKQA